MMNIPLVAVLAALLAASASAAAPTQMTYQGRLRESNAPVTGSRQVNIYLCDAPAAGTCTPTGEQTVTVTNSLFRTVFTVPPTVNLQAGTWYLEVRLGAGGATTLSPREELTASPYALVSGTATAVVDGVISSAKLAANAVATAHLIDGAVTSSKLAEGSVASGKIADGGIVSGKLATDSVSAATIQAGSVTTAKLGAGSVVTAKLSDGAVTTAKLAPESFGPWHFLGRQKLGAGAGTISIAVPTLTYYKVIAFVQGKPGGASTAVRFNGDTANNYAYSYILNNNAPVTSTAVSAINVVATGTTKEYLSFEATGTSSGLVIVTGIGTRDTGGIPDVLSYSGTYASVSGVTSIDLYGGGQNFQPNSELIVYGRN